MSLIVIWAKMFTCFFRIEMTASHECRYVFTILHSRHTGWIFVDMEAMNSRLSIKDSGRDYHEDRR